MAACGVVVLVLWLVLPGGVGAQSPAGAIGDGQDAFGLRLGLLCFVGLALAGGVYAQYQAINIARRGRGGPRRERAVSGRSGDRSGTARVGDAARSSREGVAAVVAVEGLSARRAVPPRPVAVPTLAEERCARAVAAAHGYDRRTTLAAFRAALACDPEVKPSAIPGFWEMPSGGQADLARAYLERGQALDARSVLTVAMMLHPHNRELEGLAREAAIERRGSRTA